MGEESLSLRSVLSSAEACEIKSSSSIRCWRSGVRCFAVALSHDRTFFVEAFVPATRLWKILAMVAEPGKRLEAFGSTKIV